MKKPLRTYIQRLKSKSTKFLVLGVFIQQLSHNCVQIMSSFGIEDVDAQKNHYFRTDLQHHETPKRTLKESDHLYKLRTKRNNDILDKLRTTKTMNQIRATESE